MCGICGIVDFSRGHGNRELVSRMAETIKHRGPDHLAVLEMTPAVLGHTRLSILDLSSAGHQPMRSADKKVVIVHNGEIYNFRELRHELEKLGHTFKSKTDTEVLLEGYRAFGRKVFHRLQGMYATAIWDANSQELLLARDRFGIKPLYYAVVHNALIFGSEIKSLLASGLIDRQLNNSALHEYLWYGNALGENTFFSGVKEFPAASQLRFSRSGLKIERFWQIEATRQRRAGLEEARSRTKQELENAVKRHLVSDVPVGVFLSGGIDSSAITAFASKLYSGKLQTFSVGFDFEKGVNELDKARLVANTFQTDHHEITIAGPDIRNALEALVSAHDEPFADAANLPLYLLCQRLKGQIKVVLQGDGGDEIFGGYKRYQLFAAGMGVRILSKIVVGARKAFGRKAFSRRIVRIATAMAQRNAALRMALIHASESTNEPPTRILAPGLLADTAMDGAFQRYEEMAMLFAHLEPAQQMLYTDCAIQLKDTYLEKVDKPAMSHGIEVRVPFLDNTLTEYVLGLPASFKVRPLEKKWLLRKALRGVVPNAILDAPKTGFGVPFSYWLRTSLHLYAKDILLDAQTRRSGLFDQPFLSILLHEHKEGQRDHGQLLWKALHLALWHDKYLASS